MQKKLLLCIVIVSSCAFSAKPPKRTNPPAQNQQSEDKKIAKKTLPPIQRIGSKEAKIIAEVMPNSIRKAIIELDAASLKNQITAKPSLLESRDAEDNTPLLLTQVQTVNDGIDRKAITNTLIDLGGNKDAMGKSKTKAYYIALKFYRPDFSTCKRIPQSETIYRSCVSKPSRDADIPNDSDSD